MFQKVGIPTFIPILEGIQRNKLTLSIFKNDRINVIIIPYKVRVRIKTIISLGFALNCMSCKAGLTGPCLDDETPTSLTCPANNVCGRLDCEGSGVEMLILACIPKAGQPLECSTVVRKIGK